LPASACSRLTGHVDVATILGDASEDQVRDYEDSLRKLKSRASTDLQQNVLQNRTQFIKISKEAEKLKAEMLTLKNLMSELKANTTVLRTTSSAGGEDSALDGGITRGMSKRDKRSSVADRSALWNSQMQVSTCPLARSLPTAIY
jgi:exocyst complex component 8